MGHLESLAYRDGASEVDYMEEAGSGVALVAHDYVEERQLDRHVLLLCGKGNNAGDAYVAGIHLLHLDYEVVALQLAPLSDCSKLCRENHRRFLQEGGRVHEISNEMEFSIPLQGIFLDGLFGTGFKGTIEEPYASIIELANRSRLPIISIDIPSGLDGETGEAKGNAIIATETAFLGLPKTGFFLNQGWNHVGKLRYVDFGLPQEYIEDSDADLIMLGKDLLRHSLPPLVRNRHKYQAGFVVGLAGSHTMPGAAILSSSSALHGGAGIVHLLHPAGMEAQLSNAPCEVIRVPYSVGMAEEIIESLNKASATFIGPGLGRSQETRQLLRKVIPRLTKPCVLDADALFFLAEEDIPLPEKTVLTPHRGELARLLKIQAPLLIGKDFLNLCQEYAESKRVTLILKGGPSFIFHPGELIQVCPTGDPGMATAGSGDVLTGLIAALLAQGLNQKEAASLGVYIHGLAGEHAALDLTSYCLTASDIMAYFPEGFSFLDL